MKRILNLTFTLMLFAGLLAGCAGSKKMAAPHPLSGMWDYAVDTPDGIYRGVVVIAETEDGLSGTIAGDGLSGDIALDGLTYEDNQVNFSFDGGNQFGTLVFQANVLDDQMDGTISVEGIGDLPVTGEKKTDM